MERLSSIEELADFRSRVLKENRLAGTKPCLVLPAGTCGQASGSNDILRVVKRYILEKGLQDKIGLRVTGCQGFCEMAPFIIVEPGRNLYPRLKMDDVPAIVKAALSGDVAQDLLYRDPETQQCFHTQSEIPFFKHQARSILGQNQHLDPIRIMDYLENGGYTGLQRVLENPDPAWIIEEMKKSELRGRGGAGFPTGLKWELAHKSQSPTGIKYLVCNADEGDPGAYMDRSLLEGNPHAIIEGMMIGGVAIGATRGLIYARTEYPLAIKHALIALRQARELGLLGHNLLGTGLDFDIDIVRGAGAFVCGEETALIRSIEGYMGEPKQRPPYPIAKGIDGNPTCINNVETLANVPMIMSKGAEEYAEVGVERNRGTKIFSLVGKIKNTGLVEVPLGMKIKDVVYEIGGGAPGDAKVKAVQTGGPSGGCIPAERFDLSISYDSLAEAGSIMGSGGMIVMDENTCMVDVAKYFVGFLKEESCGKCFTCRKGTQRMYEILENISKGKGDLDQIDLLEELAHVVRDTTMCGLGQTSPNPVISALRYYRDELVEHLRDKRCRAGVCVDLVGSPCQDACPLDTEAWRYVAHIARGEYEAAYQAIREANPFPSVCARVCNHPCEARCKAGRTGGRPVAIRHLKRFVTDQVDPSVYQPSRQARPADQVKKMAVVGSGPAGLTAAHHLSLRGHEVTVFEAESKPGGMLINGIPAYRLPREILSKEIESLVDENVSLVTGKALGRDLTIDELFSEGFDAVFLAMGAHKSRMLDIEGEELENVYPAIQFLKAHNLHGASLARGRVGVIGGGDSAVDAARVALRQEGVQSVTIMYRRTRPEMPALSEEVEEAVREGVKLRTLVTPVKIHSRDGLLTGVELLRNKQGEYDSSGRKRPVPVEGTEHVVPLDVLIVTIGDQPDVGYISSMGIEVNDWGAIQTDPDTLACNRPGVFAGGDVVTGPNTVVQAIAAGKKAAVMMDRYVCGEQLVRPAEIRLPRTFVAPPAKAEDVSDVDRVAPPSLGLDDRKRSFAEVELTLTEEQARLEALRCLRCDLDFTDVEAKQPESQSGRAATESNTS